MILQPQLVEPRVRVWHAINQARKVKGLRSLALSSTICRIAEDHATDMNYRGYTRATAPDGLTPQQRLQYAPYQWTQGLVMILRSSSDHAADTNDADTNDGVFDSDGSATDIVDTSEVLPR